MLKRIFILIISFFFGFALFSGLSSYAGELKEKPKKEEKTIKEYDFEGDVVEAQFLRPDQGVTEAIVKRKKSSLIQIRTDFVDEILKSAEDL